MFQLTGSVKNKLGWDVAMLYIVEVEREENIEVTNLKRTRKMREKQTRSVTLVQEKMGKVLWVFLFVCLFDCFFSLQASILLSYC